MEEDILDGLLSIQDVPDFLGSLGEYPKEALLSCATEKLIKNDAHRLS